jgi:hypothetical protein
MGIASLVLAARRSGTPAPAGNERFSADDASTDLDDPQTAEATPR